MSFGNYAGLISQGLGATMSNFVSIATANKRAHDIRKRYETQARLAEYNRKVLENQAIAERQNAKAAEQAAKIQKEQRHDANQVLREKQLAIMAKNGVLNEGTPILVQEDQLAEMKLKENDILYKGEEEKRQHENKASYFDSGARMQQYNADVARATGKYRSDMIKFQKKLTIAKMFYDPGNVTTFGEVDNPSQYKHTSVNTIMSAINRSKTSQPRSRSSVSSSSTNTNTKINPNSTSSGSYFHIG